MEKVLSFQDLTLKNQTVERSFLLLYKSGSEVSNCALANLAETMPLESPGFKLFSADVSEVRDIHTIYGITSVPSLLLFDKGNFINVIKGCQHPEFYKALAENAVYQATAQAEGKTAKSVRVYTTPTCSWCNTLKAFLRKNNIQFTETDVSRDQQAAAEMVRMSGQQGVPQTEINGQMVVGFNQQKIKELLEIQ